MKVLVLGGTGRTGSLVTRAALTAGHEVTVLVRDPTRLRSVEDLRVLTGDARNRNDMEAALEGQTALISALGSRSVVRSDIATAAASNFVSVAEAKQTLRVIVMSAFGVGDTYQQAGILERAAFATIARSLYRDKTEADDIVKRSGLDWTLVHPVTLTDGPPTGGLVATERLTGRETKKVTRADVANFLVTCVTDPEWSRKTVILAS